MKETINTTKKLIKIRFDELIVSFVVPIIVFIIGHTILRFVLEFDNSDDLTSFELGTVLSSFISLLIILLIGTMNFRTNMAYAVSMSNCRKNVITAHIAHAFIKGFILTTLMYIFHTFEGYVCRNTYKHIPMEFDFDKIFKPEIFPVFILFIAAIEIFIGSLLTRFGQKIYWIIYAVCIFCFSAFPSMITHTLEGNATGISKTIGQFLIDIFNGMTINTLLVAICCICAIIITLPYVLLRKYRVAM